MNDCKPTFALPCTGLKEFTLLEKIGIQMTWQEAE